MSKCLFHKTGDEFQGSCGKIFDEIRTLKLTRAAAITSGFWSKTRHPDSVWSGTMTEEGNPDQPIELEIYSGGWGILRTGDAWVPVAGFTLSPAMSFDADATHEVAPNNLDRAIVHRAAAILSTVAVWNRLDNRKCPNAAAPGPLLRDGKSNDRRNRRLRASPARTRSRPPHRRRAHGASELRPSPDGLQQRSAHAARRREEPLRRSPIANERPQVAERQRIRSHRPLRAKRYAAPRRWAHGSYGKEESRDRLPRRRAWRNLSSRPNRGAGSRLRRFAKRNRTTPISRARMSTRKRPTNSCANAKARNKRRSCRRKRISRTACRSNLFVRHRPDAKDAICTATPRKPFSAKAPRERV